MLDSDHLVGGRALLRQAAVQPGEGGGHLRVSVAQAAQQRHGEGDVERAVLVAPQGRLGLRLAAAGEQPVGQGFGLLARRAPPHQPLGQAAQVLDQDHAQRDRHRPELADGQRLHPLVGADEAPQRLLVEPAVGMGDEIVGERVDPRVAAQGAVAELRQLAIEGRRQVLADLAQLLLDEVEVVDQPLRRRCHRALRPQRFGDGAVGGQQHPAVLPHPGPQPAVPGPPAAHPLRAGERRRVLLEALDAPELVADRLLDAGERRRQRRAPGLAHELRSILGKRRRTQGSCISP